MTGGLAPPQEPVEGRERDVTVHFRIQPVKSGDCDRQNVNLAAHVLAGPKSVTPTPATSFQCRLFRNWDNFTFISLIFMYI
jgi:hypothetical protein